MARSLSLLSIGIDGARVVLVGGELDTATAPQLAVCLDAIGGVDVILDLWDVSFIDAAGFDVVASAHQRLEDQGNRLILRDVHATEIRALEVLGLGNVLHFDAARTG